jgi:iron-sulfur cluster assembly accessory protein
MISLSENAARKLKSMQEEVGDDAKVLRLMVEAGGCSGFQYGMSFDYPKSDDIRTESEGVAMILDPASYDSLKDVRIDFDDGLNGKGFEIINPAATSTCGCGKSFN